MAYDVESHDDSTVHEHERPARKAVPQNVFGGLALVFIGLVCGWTLYTNLAGTHPDIVVTAPTVTVLAARPTPARVAAAQRAPAEPTLLIAPTFDIALLDATASFGLPPTTFSRGRPAGPAPKPVIQVTTRAEPIPLPAPRPAGLGQAAAQRKVNDPFEKLFGKPQDNRPALAYAPADSGVFNNGQSAPSVRLPQNDGLTAIYDITARTVYMPDGTKLEAHSGLGPKMDDPGQVHVKMHGATPPHVYDLAPREALFHGDEALRMHPVGGADAIFGRAGLLTHSYLLGPNGQSNGCVSFKDYLAFLNAYKAGKVKRMVVVASLDDPQLDLRIVDRRPAQVGRRYTSSIGATFSRPEDDRYLPDPSASRASRTSSSARSL